MGKNTRITITTKYWSDLTKFNCGKVIVDEVGPIPVPGWKDATSVTFNVNDVPENLWTIAVDWTSAIETIANFKHYDIKHKVVTSGQFECVLCEKKLTQKRAMFEGVRLDHLVVCHKCCSREEKRLGIKPMENNNLLERELIKKIGQKGVNCEKCLINPAEKSGAHCCLLCTTCADKDLASWEAYEEMVQSEADYYYGAARREALENKYWEVYGQPYDERYE
jgi:hypothetical protein